MRLGRLEKAILLAILEHGHHCDLSNDAPMLLRDHLPHLLFGWEPISKWLVRYEYQGIPEREYRSKQAALTRALQSLLLKGLIECGNSNFVGEIKIYSERRAKLHGIEPAKPLSDAELKKTYYPHFGGQPLPSYTERYKPMHDRNIKGISLTEKGLNKAKELLKVKSQDA